MRHKKAHCKLPTIMEVCDEHSEEDKSTTDVLPAFTSFESENVNKSLKASIQQLINSLHKNTKSLYSIGEMLLEQCCQDNCIIKSSVEFAIECLVQVTVQQKIGFDCFLYLAHKLSSMQSLNDGQRVVCRAIEAKVESAMADVMQNYIGPMWWFDLYRLTWFVANFLDVQVDLPYRVHMFADIVLTGIEKLAENPSAECLRQVGDLLMKHWKILYCKDKERINLIYGKLENMATRAGQRQAVLKTICDIFLSSLYLTD